MLLSREEMAFDFGGAKLDPVGDARAREALVWAVQQALYGEITGVQIGHWLFNAPDLEAARFFSRQAVEEFQHVGNFLRILEILGAKPGQASWPVRFLATTLMGGDFAEHVAMEMALGEGLVLQSFYAMIDTVDEAEIVAILRRAVKQEERHVEFGEQRTMRVIQGKPWLRRRLLGLSLVTLWGVAQLDAVMKSRLPQDQPVLRQLPALVRHSARVAETRLMRIGLCDRPLSSIPAWRKLLYVIEAYGGKLLGGVLGLLLSPLRAVGLLRPRRLTETYLDDPLVRGNLLRAQSDDDVDDDAHPRRPSPVRA